MRAKPQTKSARPQDLIHRRDRVLAVLYPPTATHARIIGKGRLRGVVRRHRRVVGAYTGLADVGTTTMTECVTIARWIADGVSSTTLHTKWPSSRWTKSAAA
jgi:hypothetical protein